MHYCNTPHLYGQRELFIVTRACVPPQPCRYLRPCGMLNRIQCLAYGTGSSMRIGRAALIGSAVLAAALVVVLWAVPSLLDWTRYRDSVESLATSGIGRPVRIDGAISLHLLPQPILTASGIAVDDTGDGVVLTAQELRLRVALGSLLAGKVDARDLTLRGADLRLPWPPASGALAQRPPAWLTGLQARVEQSRIQVGGLAVTGIDAVLTTDPETGTLSAAGTGQVGPRPWRFTARLTRPGRDDAAGLDVSLDGLGPLRDTGGTFSGQLAGDGALMGRVAGRGSDLARLLPGPAVAWRGEGRLNAAAGLAVADELALEIGGSPARGAVALRVLPEARLDLALAAGRLDLDAWLPVLLRGAETTMPTGIDLSAEAATLAGGTLRRLRGAFDLDPDGVTVRDVAAMLPGDAQINLSGRLPRRPRTEGAAPRPVLFEGTGHLAAPDRRSTFRWLETAFPMGLERLPPAVLKAADLSAKLSVGPGQASLAELQGSLDGNQVTGGLAIKLGPRLSIGAGLSFNQLALDPWLPDVSKLATPAGMANALATAATVDADVHLQVKNATWRGLLMGQVALDAQTEATRLTLRRLEADPVGMRLTASGTVGEGGRVTEGRIELAAPDLTSLRTVLPAELPVLRPLLRGPGTGLLQFSGPPDAMAAKLSLEASDLRVEAQPTLNLLTRRWVGPVTLRHPGAPRLLEQAGLGATAAWLGDGSMSLLAQVTASEGRAVLDHFNLIAGTLRAGGQLTFEWPGERGIPRVAVSGQIAAETLPLPLLYLRSPNPLPVAALLGWQAAVQLNAAQVLLGQTPALQDLAVQLALQDGVLTVPNVSARLAGGMVSGSVTWEASGEPPRLSARLDIADAAVAAPTLDTALDLTEGAVDAKLDLTAAGYSPAALLATLSGSANISVRDGMVGGFDIPALAAALADADRSRIPAQVSKALTAGVSPFSRLDLPLQVRRGVFSGEGTLASPAGNARITGSIDMLSAAADLLVAVRPGAATEPSGPELSLRVTGAAAGLQRTPELAGLSMWLAERP